MFKAVIFDMDGVIIDSEPLHFESDKRVMKRCGHSITDSELSQYVGMINPVMWTELKQKFCLKETIEELLEIQASMKLELLEEFEADSIPGIRELLEVLKKNDNPMAIASSSSRDFIEKVINRLGLRPFFKEMVSSEEVFMGKPEPYVFLKAADLLNVRPEECVVIEDSANGVKAARTAGMKCIGFKNVNSGCQDLSAADITVNSIYEIDVNLLKRLFD